MNPLRGFQKNQEKMSSLRNEWFSVAIDMDLLKAHFSTIIFVNKNYKKVK